MSTHILDHSALAIVVGKPNAGKTTLFKELEKYQNCGFVSMGELCRAEITKDSELWRRAKAHMEKAKSTLWPTEVIAQLLDQNLNGHQGQVIFDGLLRAPEQVHLSWEIARHYGRNRINVFVIDTTDAECITRAGTRGRSDDEDIEKRLSDYHRDTVPAIVEMVRSSPLDVDKLFFDSTNMFTDAPKYARIMADILGLRPKVLIEG